MVIIKLNIPTLLISGARWYKRPLVNCFFVDKVLLALNKRALIDITYKLI